MCRNEALRDQHRSIDAGSLAMAVLGDLREISLQIDCNCEFSMHGHMSVINMVIDL